MGFHRGPKIVTDGLTTYVDAANPKSYPGTGTTWNNLKGSIDGTISGGFEFENTNNGGIIFDAVDSYVMIPDNTYLSQFTLECVFNADVNQNDNYQGILCRDDNSIFGNYGFFGSADKKYVRFGFKDSLQSSNIEVFNSNYLDLVSGNDVHYLGTFDGAQLRLYRNGELINSMATNKSPDNTSNSIIIGSRNASGIGTYNFKGIIYLAKIYNRALNVDEVRQNYNATKSRFGL